MKLTLILLVLMVAGVIRAQDGPGAGEGFRPGPSRFQGQPGGVAQSGPSPATPGSSTASDILIYYINQVNPDKVAFGQCIPFRKNANPVNFARFSKPATCIMYVDEACKQLQHPIPIPILPNVNVQNVVGLGSQLAGSYACYEAKPDSALQIINQPNEKPSAPVP
ncbi:unnamed protein product [Absidia cylindrospora]